jgi:microcin C transport system substrate-binding protein
MFNFEWSNETLFYGLYDRVESFWQNSDLQAHGVPSEGELALLQPLVDEGLLDASMVPEGLLAGMYTGRLVSKSLLGIGIPGLLT